MPRTPAGGCAMGADKCGDILFADDPRRMYIIMMSYVTEPHRATYVMRRGHPALQELGVPKERSGPERTQPHPVPLRKRKMKISHLTSPHQFGSRSCACTAACEPGHPTSCTGGFVTTKFQSRGLRFAPRASFSKLGPSSDQRNPRSESLRNPSLHSD